MQPHAGIIRSAGFFVFFINNQVTYKSDQAGYFYIPNN